MNYKQKQMDMFDKMGMPFDEDVPIFASTYGRFFDPRNYEDLFKGLTKAAGLKDVHFHSLRHTFATRALEAGMDIKVLSVLLDHSQASTTLNLYGHALPDHKRVSMEKMREFYSIDVDTNENGANKEAKAS